uniref:Uncharacterized protein n=1 Tax=Oryza brachyantha TaxID=4533 RepID=J3NBN5_ORYBR
MGRAPPHPARTPRRGGKAQGQAQFLRAPQGNPCPREVHAEARRGDRRGAHPALRGQGSRRAGGRGGARRRVRRHERRAGATGEAGGGARCSTASCAAAWRASTPPCTMPID